MPSPRKGESQNDFISSGGIFIYEDPKTGELYHYARKGLYKKNGRTLTFVKQSRGDTMTDLIMQADQIMQDIAADEKAGYPPNCKPGYVEKDGKCVPKEETAEWSDKNKKKKKKKDQ